VRKGIIIVCAHHVSQIHTVPFLIYILRVIDVAVQICAYVRAACRTD